MSSIRVAVIAPPWLPIPPRGYGGIENVIRVLVPELIKLGVEVELFTTGDSRLEATKNHWLYKRNQFKFMHAPWYDAAPVAIAHIQYALNIIREDGKFDVIHDHNNFFGPFKLFNCDDSLPPAIHTLHNPRFTSTSYLDDSAPDQLKFWRQFARSSKMSFVALSDSLSKQAPKNIRKYMLQPVHNAVDLTKFPFVSKKENYFITLARFHPEKGQHIAVQACKELGKTLKMAGNVGDLSRTKLLREIKKPASTYRGLAEFRYFSNRIAPNLTSKITYVGEVKNGHKREFISHARALLSPVQWEEPFGMAAVEALACGTPVIAMNRGALPEIIKHGVNGFLANNEQEFKQYIQRIDEIDPLMCRKSAEQNFSGRLMAERYLERYKTAIAKSKA